jgi:hypothetical protein
VIAHIVLFRPRPDLGADDARALIDALSRAVSLISGVRSTRIGRRARLGVAYEQMPQPDLPYIAIVEFDDLAGLRKYLEHPAHTEIGRRFWEASAEQQVYDFEMETSLDAAAWSQDF